MKENKNKYQFVLVFNPKAESEAVEKIIKKVGAFLEEKGASIAKKESQGMKELAYEVAGFRKGNFQLLDVEGDNPIKLTEINLFLNRESNVIRYLILKK